MDASYNDELKFRAKCYHDFGFYSQNCLKIRTKSGGVDPFVLNHAQKYIWDKLERQKADKGRVRAIILKGRQQGCSTLIGARYYWLVTHNIGYRVFILTHLADATANLFNMVHRFHNSVPELFRAKTGAESAKELRFVDLESSYGLGTARSAGAGRSETTQLFHGSEVAYWPDAADNAAGVMQSVPKSDGTEIILESTANGVGNYYHTQCMEAASGQSDYQLIFVPWYWQSEYCDDAKDYEFDGEERELAKMYGISNEQLAWRRVKIKELGGDWRFKQEYPFTVSEAFQTSGRTSFVKIESIERARKAEIEPSGPIILGVDPALTGDRTSLVVRQGRKVLHLESFSGVETFEPVMGRVMSLMHQYRLDYIVVDSCGIGFGLVDELRRNGLKNIVAMNSAESSIWPDKYANWRAQVWDSLRQWLDEGADIPDIESLAIDLQAPAAGEKSVDGKGRLKLQSKQDIKRDGFKSPDEGDALALTFAIPVEASGGTRIQSSNRARTYKAKGIY